MTGLPGDRKKMNPLKRIPFRQQLLYVLIFNTLISITLSYLSKESLLNELIVSNCFGFSIFFSFQVYAHYFTYRRATLLLPLLAGSLVGMVLVIVASTFIHDITFTDIYLILSDTPKQVVDSLMYAFVFGAVILYFILSKVRDITARHALREQQFKLSQNEKQLAQAQLRLLQAQVEPHFLFNTLSNIDALVEVEPKRSKKMLKDLTQYLRAALSHSRSNRTTLGEELELLERFLAISQVRMGERLSYSIDVPLALLSRSLPPMLLQPLVENAIKHGIEPSAQGGKVIVKAEADNEILRITVSDTGLGLQSASGSGFGIANIRERLNTLYEGKARIEVRDNPPHGVISILEVPGE